ncbi:hypothetical protein BJ165DRAFT_1461759 [Panaeolus papilionaceus]|nr:hypothetical protein BJ165DRAFT_1461759 [Panaeolus papilionaceus]
MMMTYHVVNGNISTTFSSVSLILFYMQLFVSIARMHHISNPSKFRRLKRFAVQAPVSGLVKTGKPGVLVFDGTESSIKKFLQDARGLRYLDFHHVDTKSYGASKSRIIDGTPGLREVESMADIIDTLDKIGEKSWFRSEMGMTKE